LPPHGQLDLAHGRLPNPNCQRRFSEKRYQGDDEFQMLCYRSHAVHYCFLSNNIPTGENGLQEEHAFLFLGLRFFPLFVFLVGGLCAVFILLGFYVFLLGGLRSFFF
jgi:hypothetical protein